MTETVSTPVQDDAPKAGLGTRLIGVVFAPRDAYTAVAANPRWLGAMLVCGLVYIAAQVIFLSTEVGQNASLDQQLSVMKALGLTVTDQMVQQMQSRLPDAPYSAAPGVVGVVALF